MTILTFDGETGMRANEVDDWATYGRVTSKYKAFHQKVWFVERHDALIRSALQFVESYAVKEIFVVSFVTVLGLVSFIHNVLASINKHTPIKLS